MGVVVLPDRCDHRGTSKGRDGALDELAETRLAAMAERSASLLRLVLLA